MTYNLFLDDVRKPIDVTWVEIPLQSWKIVRNYAGFVRAIQEDGLPRSVSFDHDLADEHYEAVVTGKYNDHPENIEKLEKAYTEKTGYECAKFLFEYCLERDLDMPEFHVHSMNPVGSGRIKQLLEGYEHARQRLKSL